MGKALLAAAAFVLAACSEDPPRESAVGVVTDTAAGPRPASPEAEICASDGGLLLHVPSPDWRDQVVYMALLDRFQDGDPTNNDHGFGEYDPTLPTHFSGGDLKGIIDRLDYLGNLGATAIWVSPVFANQWWSTPYQATGWHGYWPTHFLEIDPHFGTVEDYKRLSHELHCRGMYLLKDVIANHVGNFFIYDGEYDPSDTAKNFRLLEPDSHQPAPTQYPFNLIDRLNPEHAAADIYHWTPGIQDFADPHQEHYYSLGHVSDINTENPQVVAAFKEIYKHWIEAYGVDAFRMDTTSLVPFAFWNRFLRDEDGIYAHARRLGKEHFLTLGEATAVSEPYDDAGERRVAAYLEQDGKLGPNSMLGYPLYHGIRRGLAEGMEAAALAYRLSAFVETYRDPFVIPNFVDNHDTARFLSTAPPAALKQALAVVFTIPGIPIIYQGTEQGLVEARQAMFAGGYRNADGSFDEHSAYFRYLKRLTSLRHDLAVLRRGSFKVLASESSGPGLLAYRRYHGDDVVIVLMNTADHGILVHRLDAGLQPQTRLRPLFGERWDGDAVTDSDGRLSLSLPARGIAMLEPTDQVVGETKPPPALGIAVDAESIEGAVFERDFELSGRVAEGGAPLRLIVNGNVDQGIDFIAGAEGRWRINVPVRDLGEEDNHLEIYSAQANELSPRIAYSTRVTDPQLSAAVEDPPDDARGPAGRYLIPQQPESGQQREILSVHARAAGRNLELTLTMAEITTPWLPPFGFDNVMVTTFFDLPGQEGSTVLPLLDATAPDSMAWDLAHVARGWSSYTYRAAGSTAERQGEKLGVSPEITADKNARTITFFYRGALLGVDDWAGTRIYVTTWTSSAEGDYTDIRPEPSQWFFGGGEPGEPKILDDVMLLLDGG